MEYLINNSILMSQKSLDFLWQKQKVILENIANAETPGYKAKYITFEDELKNRINAASGRSGTSRSKEAIRESILGSTMRVNVDRTQSQKMDGNNVNADVENVEMVRTSMQYDHLLKSINDEFGKLRTVIKGA